MPLLRNQSLLDCNTLRIAASAQHFYRVESDAELLSALEALQGESFLLLGGGSNVVLQSTTFASCVQQSTKGIALVSEDAEYVTVDVAAGEIWHDFVTHCLQQGWHGLENLALIPGTVGAAPIQNIGAYGVEVGEFIEQVTAYERSSGKSLVFSRADCEFAYRDSVFKHRFEDALVISSVRFRLNKTPSLVCSYAGIADTMQEQTPQALYEAVIALRRSKLPDPADLPNVGSFFKNPIVSVAQANALAQQFPGLVQYAHTDSQVKLAAAWLVDQAGWKAYRNEKVGVHAQQALVLVNHGGGSGDDILTLSHDIQHSVAVKFGVSLQPEPRIY